MTIVPKICQKIALSVLPSLLKTWKTETITWGPRTMFGWRWVNISLVILDNNQAVLAVLQSSSELIKDALTELDEVRTPWSSVIKVTSINLWRETLSRHKQSQNDTRGE